MEEDRGVARRTAMVFAGKPLGVSAAMGALAYLAQRKRSLPIQMPLSVRSGWLASDRNGAGEAGHVLFTAIGGRLPVAFITPPRKMGMNFTSHCLNAGEFWEESEGGRYGG